MLCITWARLPCGLRGHTGVCQAAALLGAKKEDLTKSKNGVQAGACEVAMSPPRFRIKGSDLRRAIIKKNETMFV